MLISRRRSYLLAAITIAGFLLGDAYYMTAIGLGLFVFVLIDFVEKLGETIPILEVMLLISCLQWILGPYLDYVSDYRHYKYYMYVPEEDYMNLVVPSLFLFAMPLYYFSSKINYVQFISRIRQLKISDQLAITLVVVGFLAEIVGRVAPAAIGFVFFLASGLRFIGLLYLFYSGSKKRWRVFWIVLVAQFVAAITGGIFHSLLLWIVFMLIFILVFYRFSFKLKLVYISIGFAGLVILQAIKGDYREAIWRGKFEGTQGELFVSIFYNKVGDIVTGRVNNKRSQEDELGEVNNRLNQGWIISRIMSQIPARTPYLEGETVTSAISASLVPRFLVESKAEGGGGRITYERLTGFKLLSASMGTGVLGEAYGNYGVGGTYIFMFIWGLILAIFFRFIFSKAAVVYSLPLWLPIIFLQVVKAETDLFTVLNHLVKSSIFVFGVIYIIRHILKIRL